jgi:hypothetical protein
LKVSPRKGGIKNTKNLFNAFQHEKVRRKKIEVDGEGEAAKRKKNHLFAFN